jgi:hypothetical protein
MREAQPVKNVGKPTFQVLLEGLSNGIVVRR